jgi:hypothetical protein
MSYSAEDLKKEFPTNDECLTYLYTRFKDTECRACGRTGSFHRHRAKACYTCNCGQVHIYPQKGTLFESSALPLTKWFEAIMLVAANPQKITGKQLERELKIAYPTAWRLKTLLKQRVLWLEGDNKEVTFHNLLDACINETVVEAPKSGKVKVYAIA